MKLCPFHIPIHSSVQILMGQNKKGNEKNKPKFSFLPYNHDIFERFMSLMFAQPLECDKKDNYAEFVVFHWLRGICRAKKYHQVSVGGSMESDKRIKWPLAHARAILRLFTFGREFNNPRIK